MSNWNSKTPIMGSEPPPPYYASSQQTGTTMYATGNPTAPPIMDSHYQQAPPIQPAGWATGGYPQQQPYAPQPYAQPYSQPYAQPYGQPQMQPYIPQTSYVAQPTQPQTIIVTEQNRTHGRSGGGMSDEQCCCWALLAACCLACCLARD